jgi:hypothetical protein
MGAQQIPADNQVAGSGAKVIGYRVRTFRLLARSRLCCARECSRSLVKGDARANRDELGGPGSISRDQEGRVGCLVVCRVAGHDGEETA